MLGGVISLRIHSFSTVVEIAVLKRDADTSTFFRGDKSVENGPRPWALGPRKPAENATRRPRAESRGPAERGISLALSAVWPHAAVDPSSSGRYTHRFLFKGLDNEAYFSAEQPPPEAHARISCPHAYEGRPAGAFAPPSQGPQAPRGVTHHPEESRWNILQAPAHGQRRCRNRGDSRNVASFFAFMRAGVKSSPATL